MSSEEQTKTYYIKPVSGTSVGLMIRRICSIDCRSGDRPTTQ